jgi:phosphoglycerate dehydrogenase-like enzyme
MSQCAIMMTMCSWKLSRLQEEASLIALENVLLTPRLAGTAADVRVQQSAMILEDLRTLAAGDAPARMVNPDALGC